MLSHFLQSKLDVTILYSFFNEMVTLFMWGRICNGAMIPKHVYCSLKNLWHTPGVLCSNHTQTSYAPFSLSASIRFPLPL